MSVSQHTFFGTGVYYTRRQHMKDKYGIAHILAPITSQTKDIIASQVIFKRN